MQSLLFFRFLSHFLLSFSFLIGCHILFHLSSGSLIFQTLTCSSSISFLLLLLCISFPRPSVLSFSFLISFLFQSSLILPRLSNWFFCFFWTEIVFCIDFCTTLIHSNLPHSFDLVCVWHHLFYDSAFRFYGQIFHIFVLFGYFVTYIFVIQSIKKNLFTIQYWNPIRCLRIAFDLHLTFVSTARVFSINKLTRALARHPRSDWFRLIFSSCNSLLF